jgi:hypothetical protein
MSQCFPENIPATVVLCRFRRKYRQIDMLAVRWLFGSVNFKFYNPIFHLWNMKASGQE